MGTETSMYTDRNVQTNEIRSVDNSTGMTSSIMGTQKHLNIDRNLPEKLHLYPLILQKIMVKLLYLPLHINDLAFSNLHLNNKLYLLQPISNLHLYNHHLNNMLYSNNHNNKLSLSHQYPVVPQPRGLAQVQPP